jgi:hypothetical protein
MKKRVATTRLDAATDAQHDRAGNDALSSYRASRRSGCAYSTSVSLALSQHTAVRAGLFFELKSLELRRFSQT